MVDDNRMLELNRLAELIQLAATDSKWVNIRLEGEHKKISNSFSRNSTRNNHWLFDGVLVMDKTDEEKHEDTKFLTKKMKGK